MNTFIAQAVLFGLTICFLLVRFVWKPYKKDAPTRVRALQNPTVNCPRCGHLVPKKAEAYRDIIIHRIDCPKCGCHAIQHSGMKDTWCDAYWPTVPRKK